MFHHCPRIHKHYENDKVALTQRSLAVMVFMVTFEIPVVTTSLVAITESLGGFDNVSWIVTSYLLGYVGECISRFARYRWHTL